MPKFPFKIDWAMNKFDLAGRCAIVTGGAQGLGRAITERFVASGARVAIWDYDEPLAQHFAQEIGPAAIALKVDVTDRQAVEAARDATLKAFGKIDILVNNAGGGCLDATSGETDPEELRRTIRINLESPLICCQAVVPVMLRQGHGRIINIASIVRDDGDALTAHYSASKAGLIALTKTLSKQLAKHNIVVNVMTPAAASGSASDEGPSGPQDIEIPISPRDIKASVEARPAIRPVIAESANVATFLLEQGLSLNKDAQELLIDAIEDNLLAAYARLESLARGDDEPGRQAPGRQEPGRQVNHLPEASIGRSPAIGCWQLFQLWQAAVQPARGTISRWTTTFRLADSQFPDPRSISVDAAKLWMTTLINEERSAKTVATVWRTALKTVFAWALDEKLVEANPFKDVKIRVPRETAERETKSFTQAEEQIILAAALAYGSPKSPDQRARRWVPWLCAYTGARAGEITQLRGSDIYRQGNDYFAKLTPSAGTIKTRKARTVPIHEHLVEQGFIEFVHKMGSGPLFYRTRGWTNAKSNPVHNRPERTRNRLGDWVRSLGITDRELSPNHAWRHTFKARAARYGIADRYSDAITGHAPPTTGRTYGMPTTEDLAEAMRNFPRYSVRGVRPSDGAD